MKCREVQEVLMLALRGKDVMQSAHAHIEDCMSCQELARISELLSRDPQIDANQIGRLQKMIISDLRPVRPLLPSWVFASAFVSIFLALSVAGVLYLGQYGWFVLMPGQKIAVFATLASSAVLLAFSLVRQMVPGQKALLRPGLLPASLLVLLCLVVAGVFQVHADPHFLSAGEACLRAGFPYAIPAAFAFWLILRRGAVMVPRLSGAVIGLLAGLVSTTVLEVYCPNLNVWHILIWHVGIAFLGLAAGVLIVIAGQAIHNRIS